MNDHVDADTRMWDQIIARWRAEGVWPPGSAVLPDPKIMQGEPRTG